MQETEEQKPSLDELSRTLKLRHKQFIDLYFANMRDYKLAYRAVYQSCSDKSVLDCAKKMYEKLEKHPYFVEMSRIFSGKIEKKQESLADLLVKGKDLVLKSILKRVSEYKHELPMNEYKVALDAIKRELGEPLEINKNINDNTHNFELNEELKNFMNGLKK